MVCDERVGDGKRTDWCRDGEGAEEDGVEEVGEMHG